MPESAAGHAAKAMFAATVSWAAHSSIVSGSSMSFLKAARNCAPTAPSTARWSQDKRAAHHRGDRERAVLDDRALLAGADREDAAMRRVDHRGELADPEHAEVGDREGAALEFFELQLAGAGARGEVLGLGGDRCQTLAVGLLDDRRDQPVVERHRDGDVDRLPQQDRVVAPRRVRRRHLTQRERRGADHKIVDGNPMRPLIYRSASVRMRSSSSISQSIVR